MPENKIILKGISILLICYIIFNVVIFFVYLFAPLFGGRIPPLTLVIILSRIGYGLVMKFVFDRIRNRSPIQRYEFAIILFYHSGCMFLWFPLILAIMFSGFGIIATFVGCKKITKKDIGGRN